MSDSVRSGADAPPHGVAGRRLPWRAIALLAAVVALGIAAGLFTDELRLGLARLETVVREAGWAGPVIFVVVYVAWAVACLPGSLLTVLGGTLFEDRPLLAVATVSVGATLGAGACFLIARHLARDAVRRWVGEKGLLARLDEATDRHGVWFVAVTRLVPVFPFNLLNYGFGLTRVGFWRYLAVSWLCMLPGTAVYVLGAGALTRGLREGEVPWRLVGVLGAAVFVMALAGWAGKRAWHRMSEGDDAPAGPDSTDAA